jgi:hypothetical protein
MPGEEDSAGIPGTLVLAPDTSEERSTPVYDWIVAGRECPGVDERHRLVVDDSVVSRPGWDRARLTGSGA